MAAALSPPQVSEALANRKRLSKRDAARPVVTGLSKAGNYRSLVRDGSGLRLTFPTQECSEAPRFGLLLA